MASTLTTVEQGTKDYQNDKHAKCHFRLNRNLLNPLGTLSIDNEMHDDDVHNPRRIGSRVSFLVGKRKLSSVLF